MIHSALPAVYNSAASEHGTELQASAAFCCRLAWHALPGGGADQAGGLPLSHKTLCGLPTPGPGPSASHATCTPVAMARSQSLSNSCPTSPHPRPVQPAHKHTPHTHAPACMVARTATNPPKTQKSRARPTIKNILPAVQVLLLISIRQNEVALFI